MEVPSIREKFFNSISNLTDEQKKITVEKRKKTKLKKYNDPNYNNREKFNDTLNERYGGHHLRLEEFQNKCKKTNLSKIKVEYPLQLDKNYKKTIEAQKDKFSGLYVCSDEYKKKTIESRLERVIKRIEDRGFIFIDYVDDDYATMKCPECENVFTHTQIFREYDIICRNCNPISSNNSLNIFIEDILKKYNVEFSKNNREILSRKEIDYYLPAHNIGFEINGNYYHSEIHGKKDKKYHITKTINSYDKGIKLIHIFEDEIKFKSKIVESRIKNLIGVTDIKIQGRKTLIKEIPKNESTLFLNENHLQGNSIDKIRIGLYLDNDLVSIMTFGKKRNSLGQKQKFEGHYELLRFANKLNTTVNGGFSKLLKYFIKTYNPSTIITFADSRWSGVDPENTIYHKVGFNFIHQTPPNYWYVKIGTFLVRHHRFSYRKDVLVKEGFSVDKTEWEIMQEKGFDRIWDCGSMKFEIIFHN